jgi:hypothetical protein
MAAVMIAAADSLRQSWAEELAGANYVCNVRQKRDQKGIQLANNRAQIALNPVRVRKPAFLSHESAQPNVTAENTNV